VTYFPEVCINGIHLSQKLESIGKSHVCMHWIITVLKTAIVTYFGSYMYMIPTNLTCRREASLMASYQHRPRQAMKLGITWSEAVYVYA
jgi:hypothetical protein